MDRLENFFVRFSVKEQALFAKRLAFLMSAEVPILECLVILRAQTASKAKAKMLDEVLRDVSSGQFLSASLGKHGRLFGDFVINLIRVGENSGTLGETLAYVADELKKKHALRVKVLGALLYPLCITVGTIGVTAMLIVYIFPKIMPIFVSLHVSLPFSTRLLIWLSHFLSVFGVWCLVGLVVLVGAFFFARRRFLQVRWWADKVVLSMPLAKQMVRSYNLTNFCRTTGLLLSSGMRLNEALVVTADSTHNALYKRVYLRLSHTIQQGSSVSQGLAESPDLFPDMTRHLVAIGERTGKLPATLLYLCDMHEGEVEEQTKQLSTSVEPILMVIMGLMVGFVAVAVITPMYEITAHLSPR